ncbi:carbohydrate sulfotransferase 1-like isoform X2 [Panulirus ornatus]
MRWRLQATAVMCLMFVSLMLTYILQISDLKNLSHYGRLSMAPFKAQQHDSVRDHRVYPKASSKHKHTSRHGRTNILVLSSLGRSGSSFLADLVASQGGNIYFFEPVRPIRKLASREVVMNETLRYFNCDVRENLFSLTDGKNTIRLRATSKCSDGVSLTKNETAARITCQQQKVVIVKTIRLRLSWARELMDDEHLHLKMIHLVRDPRAIMLSMSDSKWGKIAENNTCPFMLQDLQYKQEMERLYPDRYFFLKYEDLCTNLEEEARRIFRFLGVLNNNIPSRYKKKSAGVAEKNAGNKGKVLRRRQKLPACVQRFIGTHTKKGNTDKLSTHRDTIHTYQRWRNHIKQDYLTYAESRCREVITILGYNFFHTVHNARNLQIPVFNESNSH